MRKKNDWKKAAGFASGVLAGMMAFTMGIPVKAYAQEGSQSDTTIVIDCRDNAAAFTRIVDNAGPSYAEIRNA